LALALGLTLVALVVIALVAFDSASNVIRQAQQTSSESLRAQAEVYLQQINASIAGQNNLILDRAARDVQAVADTTAAIFNSESSAQPLTSLGQAKNLVSGPQGQFLNKKEDVSSIFIPNTVGNPQTDPALQRDVDLSAYLDLVLPAIKKNNPNAAAIYLGSVHDMTRYYPNIMLGEVVPPDFKVTGRPWYTTSLEQNKGSTTPVPVWSPVYQDATGLGLVTTIAVPVYDKSNQLIGVVGLDLTLDEISKSIGTTRFLKTGYSFLVDQDGKAIILTKQGYQDILGRDPKDQEFAPDLKSIANTSFAQIVDKMSKGETGFAIASAQASGDQGAPSRELFVAYSPLESTGWSLGSVVAAEDVLQSVAALQQDLRATTRTVLLRRVLPLGIGISIFLVLLAFFLTYRLVNPIQKLAEAAEQIGSRGLHEPGIHASEIPIQASILARNDEIGFLANTLTNLSAQVNESIGTLEGRVAERTQQLEKRSLQIQTASEIASEITSAKDLDSMLQNAVDLISDRFGYYNVGIFLIDEIGENAQLKAASGDLGRLLLEKNIKLRVGQQGIIGYVTRFGRMRMVGDVRVDDIYQAEPLLSDTRSELAIPLLSGGQARSAASGAQSSTPAPTLPAANRAVIGALDVQNTQLDAFSEDDITVLQILADQLAIAIQNIRLLTQLQSTLQELNLFYQGQTREVWSRFAGQSAGLAYVYDGLEVRPTGQLAAAPTGAGVETPAQHLAQGLKPGNDRMLVPIQLRDQVIGVIALESEEADHHWSDDEIAIVQATAAQAALTVENARLLADSQRKAMREELSAEITTRIRSSLDMETVLHTAMNEIARRLGISQIEIQLGSDLAIPAEEAEQSSKIPPAASSPAQAKRQDGRYE
jgi:GAF domain-containing protein